MSAPGQRTCGYVFGVLVLSFAASTFGGIGRDVLMGATPPAALVDWRYLAVSLAAGLIAFFWSSLVERLRNPVRPLDAVGLAFFAVAGTQKALAFGWSPAMAALMGMLTGVGGGIVRDVLLAEIPAVLRSDLYAVAALAGAAIVAGGSVLGISSLITAILGGVICFGLRMVANFVCSRGQLGRDSAMLCCVPNCIFDQSNPYQSTR
jgi:uncharacterized membrane protein YeiH